jgi:hypothetical protein
MPYRSDEGDEEEKKDPEPADAEPAPDQSSQLLTLFNFYWLKFLSQKRVIDQERKILEDEISEVENEEKISSMRDAINGLSSS